MLVFMLGVYGYALNIVKKTLFSVYVYCWMLCLKSVHYADVFGLVQLLVNMANSFDVL